MLQALNILENADLKAMGYNSPAYIHTLYQTMNLAFADRDFYYGDPYFPPEEPVKGLLSKEYAKAALRADRLGRGTTRRSKPGDPYPFQGGTNPFADAPRTAGRRRRAPDSTTKMGITDSAFRAQFSRRHHLDRSRGRGGLGRLGDAERRLDPGGDRRAHRRRPEPAHAELRDRRAEDGRSTSSSPASARASRSRRRWR